MTSLTTANVTPTGTWDYTGGTISVKAPTVDAHAATKTYVDTAIHAIWLGNNVGGSISTSEDTYWLSVSGSKTEDSDVDDVYSVSAGAGTWKNLYVRCQTNSFDAATTIKSYINGSDGNLSVSIGAGLTGVFSDTSNSDTLAAENLIALHLGGASTSGSMGHVGYGSQLVP